MKLLVCDVEGTIFKAKYKIDGTDFASTMWQPLAQQLGEAAIEEERQTHVKWDNNEYNNYIEWVNATVDIHKRYGLHIDIFNTLIDKAEYNEGVIEFFQKIDRNKYIPVLISGGFQELIRRAQKDLRINYGYGACEYHFDDNSGLLSSHSMTPCDFDGKYNYVSTLFDVYNLNPSKDWIFIGDGKNDIHIAEKAPLSFGINAHRELAATVMYNVSNFEEIYHRIIEEEDIILLGQDELVLDADWQHKGIENDEYAALVLERDALAMRAEAEKAAYDKLQSKLKLLQTSLDSEIEKRKSAENARRHFEDKHIGLERERAVDAARVGQLNAELQNATASVRAEFVIELETLKNEITRKNLEMKGIMLKIKEQNDVIEFASNVIDGHEDKLLIHEKVNLQLQNENRQLQKTLELANNKLESNYESQRKLFANLFIHLNMSKNALMALSANKANDELLHILKSINSTSQKHIDGVRSCVWHQGNDAIEYYFSDTGRVIIVFKKAEKPFVKDIYFHHEHAK